MKRHSDALYISAGACNPSGIAHSIIDACTEVRAQGGGTCSDPAIQLMVSQLAYLTGIWNGIDSWARGDFHSASESCRAAIAQDELQAVLAL